MGASTLLRGGNVTIKPTDGGQWQSFWTAWDWDGWIKPQLDRAAALGLNSVRLIGNVSGITAGAFTQATYLARWDQFIEYAASLGLLVYPCGGDLHHWGSTTDADALAIFSAWGTSVSKHSNVFALDVTNEAFYAGPLAGRTVAATLAFMTSLTGALRAVTGLPLTHSLIMNNAAAWHSNTQPSDIEAISDFYDLHMYYAAPGASDPVNFFQHRWATKPVLVGEFGASQATDAATRAAYYTGTKALAASNSKFGGVLAWALADQSDDPTKQFGLYDLAGVERTEMTDVLKTFPLVR